VTIDTQTEERATTFARAVSGTALAFEKIKAAIPTLPSAEVTEVQAQEARDLCDRLSSGIFDLLMATLNSATALETIAGSVPESTTEEDA